MYAKNSRIKGALQAWQARMHLYTLLNNLGHILLHAIFKYEILYYFIVMHLISCILTTYLKKTC